MKISAALIMKNEEENLPRLLKSLQGKFDEIVVVDTGSTDRSIEIAKEFGCKIYEKEWSGFADARNYAISKCKGDLIWHFDADFELEEKEFEKFSKLLSTIVSSDLLTYTIKVKNFNAYGMVSGISSQAFIHKNTPEVYWEGNIHEKLNQRVSLALPIFINHYGYQDYSLNLQKLERNKKLIQQDLEIYRYKDEQEYFIKLFYMLQTLAIESSYNFELAKQGEHYIQEYMQLREKCRDVDHLEFFVNYGFVYIADIYQAQKKFQKALSYLGKILDEGYDHPDIFYHKATIEEYLGQKQNAKESYIKALIAMDKIVASVYTGVVDTLFQLYSFIEHKSTNIFEENDIERLQKRWKKERSKSLGLLLVQLYTDPLKKERLLRKIDAIFDDEWTKSFLLKHYALQNHPARIDIAYATLEKNPYHMLANKIIGLYMYENKQYKKAWRYLKNTLIFSKDPLLLEVLIDILHHLGLPEEASRLQSLKK